MARLTPADAREILRRCGAAPASDFHALRSEVVAALIREADARGYREPMHANGSRARYFHSYLERAAGTDTAAARRAAHPDAPAMLAALEAIRAEMAGCHLDNPPDLDAIAAHVADGIAAGRGTASRPSVAAALRALLEAAELNMDEIEAETESAIDAARDALSALED